MFKSFLIYLTFVGVRKRNIILPKSIYENLICDKKSDWHLIHVYMYQIGNAKIFINTSAFKKCACLCYDKSHFLDGHDEIVRGHVALISAITFVFVANIW